MEGDEGAGVEDVEAEMETGMARRTPVGLITSEFSWGIPRFGVGLLPLIIP